MTGAEVAPLAAAGVAVLVVGGSPTAAVRRAAQAGAARRRARPGPRITRGPAPPARVRRTGRLAALARQVTAWRRSDCEVEHAELLEEVARALRAGCSLRGALAQAASSCQGGAARDLTDTLTRVDAGAPLPDALERWGTAGSGEARVLSAAALAMGSAVGGTTARSLDAAAASLRDRAALVGEVRALTSQARASAVVLVVAPVAFLVVLMAVEPSLASRALLTPSGAGCVVAGGLLDGLGAWWMARLIGGPR